MFQCNISGLPAYLGTCIRNSGSRCIIVDGHTGAGKTTVVSELVSLLKQEGKHCTEFHMDWYVIDRDKRSYHENPKMMDLTGWFDIERAISDMAKLHKHDVTLMSYDRSTGRRSKPLTLQKLQPDDVIIIEGLYGLLLTETLKIDCLRFFLSLTDATIRKRLYARNTYIERARLEYEIEHIYLPSMRSYEDYLQARKILFTEIDVNDFTEVKIR